MREFPRLCPVFLPSNMPQLSYALVTPSTRILCPVCPSPFFTPSPLFRIIVWLHWRLSLNTIRGNEGNIAPGCCINLDYEPKFSQSFFTMVHYGDQASVLEELSIHVFQSESLWISDEENEVQRSLADHMQSECTNHIPSLSPWFPW